MAFVILAGLSIARLIRYPKLLLSDLTHHRTGFSFLTLVAALNVLGSAAAILHQWWGFAWVAWSRVSSSGSSCSTRHCSG